MSENQLVKLSGASDLVPKHSSAEMAAVMAGGGWLPRLQLITAKSGHASSGAFPVNHWALISGKKMTDLGAQIDVVVLAERPMAMDTSGEELIVCHEMKMDEANEPTGEFARIMAEESVQDSGCMYGPEFLLWIPQTQQFVTYFMGSKSARVEAPNLSAKLYNSATLNSVDAKSGKWQWRAPEVFECTAANLALPPQDKMESEVKKFLNPTTAEVERVDEAGGGENPVR